MRSAKDLESWVDSLAVYIRVYSRRICSLDVLLLCLQFLLEVKITPSETDTETMLMQNFGVTTERAL